MFWGAFHGTTKGPGVFWEKNWGTIGEKTYREHIVPVIAAYITANSYLQLMQGHAPGHAAKGTQQDLQNRNVYSIMWPPYSPDLNPIETLWNWMKDYIYDRYRDIQLSYPRLRAAVLEAWEAIPVKKLEELIRGMHDRCQAVIDANGMHIQA